MKSYVVRRGVSRENRKRLLRMIDTCSALKWGVALYIAVFVFGATTSSKVADWLLSPGSVIYETMFGPRSHGGASFWLLFMTIFDILIYSALAFIVILFINRCRRGRPVANRPHI